MKTLTRWFYQVLELYRIKDERQRRTRIAAGVVVLIILIVLYYFAT